MAIFLGADGGGTRTRFVLVDHDGAVVATCEEGNADHTQIGIDGVCDVLRHGLTALFRQAGIDGGKVTHAFFGLPCYGEDSVAQPRLDALPEPLLGHRRYACGNDMVCAWAGSLGGQDGINIVAGTGSIAYGERDGQAARAGGWSEIFGDEGSAYWIAVQGLNAFTRMSDGRLTKGPLHAIMAGTLELDADLDLAAKVARTRGGIAGLAPLVARAADAGDSQAAAIFARGADELIAVAVAVREALAFPPGDTVALSYSGGVFEAGPLILDPLQQQAGARRFRLCAPLLSPVLGAATYAAKRAGQPFSAAALQRLQNS